MTNLVLLLGFALKNDAINLEIVQILQIDQVLPTRVKIVVVGTFVKADAIYYGICRICIIHYTVT